MSFVAHFSAYQTLGNGAIINFLDDSSGTDGAIYARNIYLKTAQGTWLVQPVGTTPSTTPSFILWGIGSNPFAVSILSTDMALQITVNWVDSGGNTLYTYTQLFPFTNFGESFLYSLTQNQAAQPSLLLDSNYLQNKLLVRVYIDSANNACVFGNDISAATNCINIYTYIIANSTYFF